MEEVWTTLHHHLAPTPTPTPTQTTLPVPTLRVHQPSLSQLWHPTTPAPIPITQCHCRQFQRHPPPPHLDTLPTSGQMEERSLHKNTQQQSMRAPALSRTAAVTRPTIAFMYRHSHHTSGCKMHHENAAATEKVATTAPRPTADTPCSQQPTIQRKISSPKVLHQCIV
jgi:hypothetical protein